MSKIIAPDAQKIVTINGETYTLSKESAENMMLDVKPEPIRHYWVVVNRKRYPANQVLARITGLSKCEARTVYSVPILHRLGFKIHHYV